MDGHSGSVTWRIALLIGCLATGLAQAGVKSPSPSMAPLDEYLMADHQAEISLARSAAPPAISDHATVLVLARQGYETAIPGSNGLHAWWNDHLMFHIPKMDAASWGANLPGSPVVLDVRETPEPQTMFMVPLGEWSDGTPANVAYP